MSGESTLIRLQCSECGKKVKVSTKFAGKAGRCPKCGSRMQIPTLEEAKTMASHDETIEILPRPGEPVVPRPAQEGQNQTLFQLHLSSRKKRKMPITL